MRAFFLLTIFSSTIIFSQQQQLGNVELANNSNISMQTFQSNVLINQSNSSFNDAEIQRTIKQVNTSSLNSNIIQASNSLKQPSISNKNSGSSFNFSFKLSSKKSNNSNSKFKKHTFSKKFKKFERNVFGKIGIHKKSKHLVDVCFFFK
jgi:hypothetical protein